LARQKFSDGEALVEVVNAILADIEKVTLERVFPEGMQRIYKYIEAGGEYLK
jgi:hypothetical protein